MDTAFLQRNCRKCRNRVTQLVFYEHKNGELKIICFWENCHVCSAVLPAPTIEEVLNDPYYIPDSLD